MFFNWVSPLVRFTKKHQSLNFEQLGDLPDNDKVEVHLERLQNKWLERRSRGLSKNTLINSVFASFKSAYAFLFFLNAIQSILTLMGPFFINFLVEYVRTGKNPYKQYVPFFDTSDNENLKWMTADMQYGLTLSLCLVLSQAIAYILTEYTSF